MIQALRDNLVVSLPRNSRVVPVEFDSASPALAATIANSYADNLIAGNLQRHYDTSSYSKDFLQNQLTITKARLEQSETGASRLCAVGGDRRPQRRRRRSRPTRPTMLRTR